MIKIALLLSLFLVNCGSTSNPVVVVFGGSNAKEPVDQGIIEAMPNAQVIVIAKSTSHLSCFDPDMKEGECWNGYLLDELIAEVEQVSNHVDAFVWIQGGWDAAKLPFGYGWNFLQMQDKLHARFGVAKWAGTKVPYGPTRVHAEHVREFADSGVFDCVEDLEDYERYDRMHLIKSEDIRLGRTLGECLKEKL